MKKTQKILTLVNGKKIPVIGEDNRFWVTAGSRFRKSGRLVAKVEEVEIPDVEPEKASQAEPEQKEVKPKAKKKTAKKEEPKEEP